MITRISIQNFQSHENSILELSPGINILSGDSDSGKTAILRALNWVLTNRPTGEAFRREGSDKTIVTVDTSDGSISRVRSNKDNFYLDGSGEKLAAIGTCVPESVLKLLKMDLDVNVQRQLDAPFLLSCSAGEVAQRLNASVGLEEIDTGLANVARRVRQNQSAFSEIDARCEELSAQIVSFAYLADMEQEIRLVDDLSERRMILVRKEDSLAGSIQEAASFASLLAELPDIEELSSLVVEAERLLRQREKQMALMQNLSSVMFEIEDATEALRSVPDAADLLLDCEQAFSVIERLTDRRSTCSQFQAIVRDAIDVGRDLQAASKTLSEHDARFQREMPVICPLCNRKGRK